MRKPCRECGGRDVIRYSFADGDGTRVIIECRHCEHHRFDAIVDLAARRDEIARARIAGESVVSLASRFDVSRQAIYNVLHSAEKQGTSIPWKNAPRGESVCEVCGAGFRPKKSPYRRTCSRECLQKLREATSRPLAENTKWSRRKFLDLTCDECGRQFQRSQYLQSITSRTCREGKKNFCSRECNLKRLHARRKTG